MDLPPSVAARLAENLASVQDRIAAAAARSGRQASVVTLVAVTKYAGSDAAQAVVRAGCLDLGESRPQELWSKAEALAGQPVRWHLVGHLQRNKLKRTLPLVWLVHSCDSLRLLAAIDAEAQELGIRPAVLLEVNISGDPAKHGFALDALTAAWDSVLDNQHVELRGLMAMAGVAGDLDLARRDFAALRMLRDRLQTAAGDRVRLDELSMGMSGDYELAVEEGSTLVRIGSALFEGLA
ncbi:MAG TPA: YggS family pyridoxal phosphate-dependent enzyme [Pirellulales bacterium]|nr:YggS family pyridoxal phosphate-dependent enzyme [Pirellulales bacterium]